MLCSVPMVVSGGAVVDRRLRWHGYVPNAVVELSGSKEGAVGLHVVVALRFH